MEQFGLYKNISVMIIGGNHHNTLGVIRSFGESKIKDIKLLLVGENISNSCFVAKSKYVKKHNIAFVDNDNDVFGWLIKHKNEKKRVVICCSDGSAENVMSHYNQLSNYYLLPSSKENISELMEKQTQTKIAKSSGLNVPKSAAILKSELIRSWSIFPCIIKPYKSSCGGGKNDIVICKTQDDLKKILPSIVSEELYVQEFINKNMEYQLIGCSLDDGNRLIIPGYTEIIRQPSNTNTGYLRYRPITCLNYDVHAVSRFMKHIGYSGLFSLEFLRDKTGKDYFLEINLRNDGNAYCVKTAGVNLPLIWSLYTNGVSLQGENLIAVRTIFFMPELNDIKIGVKTVGFFKWLIQFFGAKSHAVFNLRDLKPFFYKIWQKFV